MKIIVQLPLGGPEFDSIEGVTQSARLLEQLGYYGTFVTDHPCPSGRWLDTMGHPAHDPFMLLTLAAAATERLRLVTGILVLPYRNPFLVTRSVNSLDQFSGGRFTLGVAAGYLRTEFNALGVDFDRRNEITDEYLSAMLAAWKEDEFTFQGSGYRAVRSRILPRPTPHPPIWAGGNTPRAIRRAVAFGEAWYPFFNDAAELAATSAISSISTVDELAARISYMKEHSESVGREHPPTVIVGEPPGVDNDWNTQRMADRLGQLRDVGVTGLHFVFEAHAPTEWREKVERFAQVFDKFPAARSGSR